MIWYFTLLICSFSSVCLSFSRLLKWGEKPVITSLLSMMFFKIFLLIFSTLFLHGAIMAPILHQRSNIAAVHSTDDLVTGEMGEIFQWHYRGINHAPEMITNDQVAYVAPIPCMVLLYSPAQAMKTLWKIVFSLCLVF